MLIEKKWCGEKILVDRQPIKSYGDFILCQVYKYKNR